MNVDWKHAHKISISYCYSAKNKIGNTAGAIYFVVSYKVVFIIYSWVNYNLEDTMVRLTD